MNPSTIVVADFMVADCSETQVRINAGWSDARLGAWKPLETAEVVRLLSLSNSPVPVDDPIHEQVGADLVDWIEGVTAIRKERGEGLFLLPSTQVLQFLGTTPTYWPRSLWTPTWAWWAYAFVGLGLWLGGTRLIWRWFFHRIGRNDIRAEVR
ncbi:MAG: hypothetical protein AAF911_03390 [Planctomycetota bacterium]